MSEILLATVMLTAFVVALRLATQGHYRNLVPAKALPLVQSGSVYILDVRNPNELKAGCLPGAHCIPLGQLSQRLAEVPRGPVLVYCASGLRSRMAANVLEKAGHQQIANLAGGFSAWSQQGMPVAPRSR